jgi:plastocyanin
MRAFWFSPTAVLIAVLGSAAVLLDKGPEAGAQATVPVAIGDNWFCDSSFANASCDTNISAGDTVVWTNTGNAPHTVTECGDAFTPCPQPGGFDSGNLNNGQTFSRTFTTAGTYEYFCAIHLQAAMRGRVIVAAAQQTPSPSPSPAPTVTTSPAGSPTAVPTGTGPTASPTPSTLPAAAPQTGGTPSGEDSGWAWLVLAIGGAMFVASASTAVNVLRRR